MKKENFVLNCYDGEFLDCTVYGKDNLAHSPCIVFVHGFKGFKDWGFGPYLAEKFAENGFFVITFNFSHNGISINSQDFSELEKFAENTFSREIKELSFLIDKYKEGFFGNTENKLIALLGHSRGGAIALLTAAQRSDIKALVLWAAVSKLDRYSERQKDKWRKKGYFEVLNHRTKQTMRLNLSLLEDIEKNSDTTLNLEKAARNLNCQVLIAHGEQDLAVPVKEGEQLFRWAGIEKARFLSIPNTGHTFDIKHPFEGSNSKFEFLLDNTIEFLIEKLNK